MYKNQLEEFEEPLETSRKIISKALDVKGFMEVHKYIIRKTLLKEGKSHSVAK